MFQTFFLLGKMFYHFVKGVALPSPMTTVIGSNKVQEKAAIEDGWMD